MRPQAQPDEGYSEENGSTISEGDTDMPTFHPGSSLLSAYNPTTTHPNAQQLEKHLTEILALPLEKRRDLAHALIPTLPNPIKEELKALINHLTHFDPTLFLPAELVLNIFSYLAPKDLLTASCISRAWRARALDERLWRLCFAREGWVLDRGKMEEFERMAAMRDVGGLGTGGKVAAGEMGRRGSRKRGRDEAFSDSEAGMGRTGGLDGAADGGQLLRVEHGSDGMEGVEATPTTTYADEDEEGEVPIESLFDHPPRRSSTVSTRKTLHDPATSPADFKVAPPIFQPNQPTPKLSWPYLYKQRRRLEHNWDNGKYRTFQLPHPDHPAEGHEECVYTIQHTTHHLVSGSRDRTIRIWDLTTHRLRSAPLRGHEASVLCLQFDSRPEHDLIVSGGSDAFVIIWRFSTGEILKKMTRAHDESVLNLRFDDRYIVTCSKDKTIKIWSRHALARDSPTIPTHVLPAFANVDSGAGEMIAEFTLLTTLLGHQAAVNAVMIHGNTIVSASGDRTIKAWDLSTGEFKKNYVGHTKGIACVQFDGRRIVSGSSDNTVRIFDAEQSAEVACLNGHTDLVRTVQARFGDLDITTDAELAEEARQADLAFFKAMEGGMQPSAASRRGPGRNAGSSRPESMLALGTRVPPGGGGSRWAKIVSGSYDESVILWKKDGEGNWVVRKTLKQADVLGDGRAGAGAQGGRRARQGGAGIGLVQPPQQQGAAGHANAVVTTTTAQQGGAATTTQQTQNANPNYVPHLLQQHMIQQQLAHQNALMANAVAVAQAQQPGPASAAHAQQPAPGPQQHPPGSQQQQQHTAPINLPYPIVPPPVPAAQLVGVVPAPPPQGAGGAAAGGVGGGHHRGGESNRVFKLQFDARRIICCSQNKVIVGWDFANGDPELERVGGWSLETA